MKKAVKYLFFTLLLLVPLAGCSLNGNSNTDIFQYKGSYVGDNSAMGNIITLLPHNKEFHQIALQTKKEPYGAVIDYKNSDETMTDKEMKETAITNSTYIFSLIRNADWLTFRFGNQEFSVTKEKLQKWYGKELKGFKNEKDLKQLIQEHVKSENEVNQFFQK